MSDFSVSGKIQTDQIETAAEFEKVFVKELYTTFSKIKTKPSPTGLLISGRVKTSVFNPIASFKGKLDVSLKGDQVRYIYDGKIGTNFLFWVTLLIFALLFLPLVLVVAIMYSKQKKQVVEEMKRLEQRLHFAIEKM